MAPPPFSDLGKQARDLFSRNYHLGIVKLDVKTKTPVGVEFNVNGVSNYDTGKVTAFLESKHSCKNYGLTFKEKWNTDNTLSTEVTLDDPFVKGVKLGFNGFFAPQTGRRSAALKTAYKMDYVHVKKDISFDHAGANLVTSAVVGHQGWLAGVQVGFDPINHKLKESNFAVGYQTPEFVLHTNVTDGQEFTGSVYQKINPNLESGIQLNWCSAQSNATKFALGGIYKLNGSSSVRAKVNNASQIGLGYTHRLRDGVTLTLCALVDGKNFNQGSHKLGLGFELEA